MSQLACWKWRSAYCDEMVCFSWFKSDRNETEASLLV